MAVNLTPNENLSINVTYSFILDNKIFFYMLQSNYYLSVSEKQVNHWKVD